MSILVHGIREITIKSIQLNQVDFLNIQFI